MEANYLQIHLTNTRGVVSGLCQVLNRRDGEPFDLDDQLLLQALAGMAGTAIDIETLQLAKEQKQAAEAVIIALVTANRRSAIYLVSGDGVSRRE